MKQESLSCFREDGGSGISLTVCKAFAPRSKQIKTPAPHLSIFYRPYALPEWPTNSVKALKAKEMCDVTTYSYNAVHCQQPSLYSKQPHIPSFCLAGLWYTRVTTG